MTALAALGPVLVANRGEIARRIIHTARRLGIPTVAVYSEADADLPYVAEADQAVPLGPAAPQHSYLNAEALLAAAKTAGARSVHPGYGFLSENAEYAEQVAGHGLTWIGPRADAIARVGDKVRARNLMAGAGIPVAPGMDEPIRDPETLRHAVSQIGFPVMLKAAAGGGGMGMGIVWDEEALTGEVERLRSLSGRLFKDDRIFVERYFPRARHVEVQVLGTASGRILSIGERECSVQRRHQKIVEETPSPYLNDDLRARMLRAAQQAARAVDYQGAGTVEFLVDPDSGEFFFLEINARLQVEHPITEETFGIDLVEAQLLVAAGQPLPYDQPDLVARGHAIELRVNAEDPIRFLPGPGPITEWREPGGPGVRIDAGYTSGNTVTPFYDPLMAKIVVHGADRAEAISRARDAVDGFVVEGPKNNLPFLARVLDCDEFFSGDYDTGLVGRLTAQVRSSPL